MGWFKDIGNVVTDAGKDVAGKVKQETSNLGQAVAKPFEDIKDQAQSTIKGIGHGVAKPFEDAYHQAEKGVETGLGSLEGYLQDAGSWLGLDGGMGMPGMGGPGGGGYGEGGEFGGPGSAAAARQADYLQQGLDYAQGAQEIPRGARESAITELSQRAGGGRATRFEEIAGGREFQKALARGEENVLRNQAATGGPRGGNSRDALQRYEQDLLASMYDKEGQELGQLAFGLPDSSGQIAGMYGDIGQTYAQGDIADAQMYQQNLQNRQNMGMGLVAGLGGLLFSDPSLKKNIRVIGEYKGLDLCEWTWNKAGEAAGMIGEAVGVMADEVKRVYPHLITEVDGKMAVDYEGLKNA